MCISMYITHIYIYIYKGSDPARARKANKKRSASYGHVAGFCKMSHLTAAGCSSRISQSESASGQPSENE